MVCIYVFPQRPSKTEQLPTAGLTPLEITSFKVKACLMYNPHPSDPHKSGFPEGNSLMPHLQTSPSRRKGKSFMSSLSPVFITRRAGIGLFAGQSAEPWGWAQQNSSSNSGASLMKQICVRLNPFSLLCSYLSQVAPSSEFCFKSISKLYGLLIRCA